MTSLALSSLLDVAAKVGKPRITKIKNIKNGPAYTPVIDFYKPLREGITAIHRAGKPKSALQSLMTGITDPRKRTNYPGALAGYETWWGNRTVTWFDPPKGKYSKNGFEVSINPELGLDVGGKRYVIKLHMNVPPLAASRAELIGALMTHVLAPLVPANVAMGVLDLRRSTLVPAGGNLAALMVSVDSVLADIAAIWPTV